MSRAWKTLRVELAGSVYEADVDGKVYRIDIPRNGGRTRRRVKDPTTRAAVLGKLREQIDRGKRRSAEGVH